MNKIEENIYQHKCCECGRLFFRKGKIHVTCDECNIFHKQQLKKEDRSTGFQFDIELDMSELKECTSVTKCINKDEIRSGEMGFLGHLYQAVYENPTARIKFNVSEDTSFYEHNCLLLDEESAVVSVEELCLDGDKYYDLEDLTDKVNNEICENHNDLTEGEYEEYLQSYVETNYKFEKIIVVRLGD